MENVESYAYELSSFEDVVGYFVADTYLTQQEKAHDKFLKHLIDYNNICKAIELQKLKSYYNYDNI